MHRRGWNDDQEYLMKTIKGQIGYLQKILNELLKRKRRKKKINVVIFKVESNSVIINSENSSKIF